MRLKILHVAVVLILFAIPMAQAGDVELVRAQGKLAAGGGALDQLQSIQLTYKLRHAGLDGTGTTLTDVMTGRTVTRFYLGPLSSAEGFDGRVYWMQDAAGIVTVPLGGQRPAQSVSAQYRQSLAQWYPARSVPARTTFRLQLLNQRVNEVLEIAPSKGLPFEIWFDAQTKHLARTVEKAANETRSTIYTDYRPIKAGFGTLMIAHQVRYSNAAADFGTERLVTKVVINPKITDANFAIPKPPKPDYKFDGTTKITELPILLNNNHVYADVALNGVKVPLLIDTGASNVITPTLARRLRLAAVGDAIVKGAGDLSAEAQFTKVASVRVGNVTLRDQVFAVVKLEQLADVEGVPFQGILGYELFKRFVVKLDYGGSKMTLIQPDQWLGDLSAAVVPFAFNGTVPEVQGTIAGIPASFEIDTGSRISVGLNSPFVLLHGLRARLRPNIEAITGWGLGGPTRGTLARVNNFRLGSMTLPQVIVDMSQQQNGTLASTVPSGAIGGGLLKRFAVTFDYANQRLYFRYHQGGYKPEIADRSGLWVNRRGNALSIEDVVAKSPAEMAGLRVGDLITAVDGISSKLIALSSMREKLRDPTPERTLNLTVQSQGLTRKVPLKLANYF